MKPTLFSAAFLALFAAAATGAQARTLAVPPADTIVVRLPNKAVMTLVVRDAQQLRQLPQYHLDSLVARLGGYIKQADAAAKTAKTDRVTMDFFPDQDQPGQHLPEQIRITTRKGASSSSAYGPSNKVEVLLEKKFGMVVNIDGKDNAQPRAAESRADRQAHRDSLRQAHHEQHSHYSTVVFDLGLNALVNQHAATGQSDVDLRTLGSRYVNIGLDYTQRLGGKHSPLHLSLGPEFAFNNYMLNGNDKWVNQNGITRVIRETDPTRQYDKTKLATSSVNLPLMLGLKLRDASHHTTFSVAAGGFIGYRLASWTKLKYTYEGNTYKDKDHGTYNLEDFQYGLQGSIGYGSVHLFAKYNMNNLFRNGQGPDTQVLSFGLRLLGN